jgi:hypothetical protein
MMFTAVPADSGERPTVEPAALLDNVSGRD